VSLVRHSASAAAAAIVLAGSRFTLAAILARKLSVSAFGQFAYGQWLVDVSFLICSLGVTAAAGRYFAEYRHDPLLLSAVARRWRRYALGLPLAAGLVAAAGAWVSGMAMEPTATVWLAIWTFSSGLWAMQTAALTGLQRFNRILLANLVTGVVMLCGAWVWPLSAPDPANAFTLMAFATATGVAFSAVRIGGRPVAVNQGIEATRWRSIGYYAGNMWITALLWSLVWSRGEMPIVRAYLGDLGVAHYAAALTVFGGAVQAVMMAVSGLAPHLTRLWGEGRRPEAIALARKVMDLQLLACGLGSVWLASLSPELMGIAFGAAYRGQASNLVILSLGLLAMAVSAQNHLLQIATDARFNRNSTLVGLGVLLTFAAWLGSGFELPGVAFARTLATSALAGMSLAVARSHFGRDAYSPRNVATVVTVAVSSGILALESPDSTLPIRACVALAASALLLASVRHAEGPVLASAMLSRLGSRLRVPRRMPTGAPRL
jgi:O-antigen/teichoic acid export membrane protein